MICQFKDPFSAAGAPALCLRGQKSYPISSSKKVMLHRILYHGGTNGLGFGLECQYQSFADDIAQLEISIDLAQVTLHVGRVAHFPQVLPDDGSAVFDIEDAEIRICSSIPRMPDLALM